VGAEIKAIFPGGLSLPNEHFVMPITVRSQPDEVSNDQDFLGRDNGVQMRLTVIDYTAMTLTITSFAVLTTVAVFPPLLAKLVWMISP
jgi:hypothetical protein